MNVGKAQYVAVRHELHADHGIMDTGGGGEGGGGEGGGEGGEGGGDMSVYSVEPVPDGEEQSAWHLQF